MLAPRGTSWCWPHCAETYGVVVTEALADGPSVTRPEVGGYLRLSATTADGSRPRPAGPPATRRLEGQALRCGRLTLEDANGSERRAVTNDNHFGLGADLARALGVCPKSQGDRKFVLFDPEPATDQD